MAECPPRCWYADSLRYPRLQINFTEQSLLLYSLQVKHHRRAPRPWSCLSVLHFSNVNILLIQAPHAASGLVQPLFMVGEKGVILDKLLPGFNYKAPQVHYTIKKSRTLYNQEISVCLLLIFCQLQCFAVNSTVSFYIMKYIAMYNFVSNSSI